MSLWEDLPCGWHYDPHLWSLNSSLLFLHFGPYRSQDFLRKCCNISWHRLPSYIDHILVHHFKPSQHRVAAHSPDGNSSPSVPELLTWKTNRIFNFFSFRLMPGKGASKILTNFSHPPPCGFHICSAQWHIARGKRCFLWMCELTQRHLSFRCLFDVFCHELMFISAHTVIRND